MNAGVQEIVNAVPALPLQGDSAVPGGPGFKGLLDSAMQKPAPPAQPELPRPAVNRSPDKPEKHRKALRAGVILQTAGLVAAPTRQSDAAPPAAGQEQMAGIETALENGTRGSGCTSQALGDLAARLVPRGAVAGPNGGVPGIALQPLRPQADGQGTPEDAKDFRVNPSSAPARPGQMETSGALVHGLIAAGVLRTNVQRSAANGAGNEQSGLYAGTTGEGIPDDRGPAPAAQVDEESQGVEPLQGHESGAQKVTAAMEQRQFERMPLVIGGNSAPLPAGPREANALTVHAQAGDHAVAANRPRHPSGGSQSDGKNRDGSYMRAEQESGKAFGKAEPGPLRDPAIDGKNGQDPSPRRADNTSSEGRVGGSALGNSISAAATGTAATAAQFVAQGQAQAPPAGTAPPGAAVLHQPAGAHSATAATLAAAGENPMDRAGAAISAAAMVQSHGKAEMRVAMQTESLGPLELHAVIDGGRLGASISVASREAHTVLTNSLPSLQQALTDRDLRVERLSVLNTSTGGASTGNGGGFHSGKDAQPRPSAPAWVFSRPAALHRTGRESTAAEILRGRLSVHA